MDAVSQLYKSIYAILYRGLERLWILVSMGGPGTNPLRDNLSLGEVKSYMQKKSYTQIFDCVVRIGIPNPCVVQWSTIYNIFLLLNTINIFFPKHWL